MRSKTSPMATLAAIFIGGASLSGCASLDRLEQRSVEQAVTLDDATLCRHYLSMYDDVPTRYGNAVEDELLKRGLGDASCRGKAPSPIAGAVVAAAMIAIADRHPGKVRINDEEAATWTWRHETSPLRGARWACRNMVNGELGEDFRCAPRPSEAPATR